jgi:hypothetical protein
VFKRINIILLDKKYVVVTLNKPLNVVEERKGLQKVVLSSWKDRLVETVGISTVSACLATYQNSLSSLTSEQEYGRERKHSPLSKNNLRKVKQQVFKTLKRISKNLILKLELMFDSLYNLYNYKCYYFCSHYVQKIVTGKEVEDSDSDRTGNGGLVISQLVCIRVHCKTFLTVLVILRCQGKDRAKGAGQVNLKNDLKVRIGVGVIIVTTKSDCKSVNSLLTIDIEHKNLEGLKKQSIEQFLSPLHEHLRLCQPLCLHISTVKVGGCFLHHLDNQDERSRLIGFRKN